MVDIDHLAFHTKNYVNHEKLSYTSVACNLYLTVSEDHTLVDSIYCDTLVTYS